MVYSSLFNKFSIAIAEAEGGLFDFDATLPGVAVVIILLVVILNFLFYQPLLEVFDKRDLFIQGNLSEASAVLSQAEKLANDLEENLVNARKEAQSIIVSVQEKARNNVELELKQAQIDTDKLIADTNSQILIQKEEALKNLEGQVDALSREIETKLLFS